jgi:ADP-glucose pyrophosphorylase
MEAPYAANMGVYVFKKAVLQDLLSNQFPDAIDFSRDVLGPACHSLDIRAFQFKGYWRDVGSLKSYYDTSMDLIKDHSAVSIVVLCWCPSCVARMCVKAGGVVVLSKRCAV